MYIAQCHDCVTQAVSVLDIEVLSNNYYTM